MKEINKIHKVDETLKTPTGMDVILKPFQLTTVKEMKLYEQMNFTKKIEDTEYTLNIDRGVLANGHYTGKTYTVLALIKDTLNEPAVYNLLNQSRTNSFKSGPPIGTFRNTTLIFFENHTKIHWINHITKCNLSYKVADPITILEVEENTDILLVNHKDAGRIYFRDTYVFRRVVVDNALSYKKSFANPKRYFTWYVDGDYKRFFYKHRRLIDLELLHIIKVHKNVLNKPPPDFNTICFKYLPNYYLYACFSRKTHIMRLLNEGSTERAIKFMGINGLSINQILHDRRQNLSTERFTEVKRSLENYKDTECSICYSDIDIPIISNCCNVILCARCIINIILVNARCPYCRKQSFDINYVANTDQETYLKKGELMLKVVNKIVSQRENNKVVLLVESKYEVSNIKSELGSIFTAQPVNYIKYMQTVEKWENTKGPAVLCIANSNSDFYRGVPLPKADVYVIANVYPNTIYKRVFKNANNPISGKSAKIICISKADYI